MIWYFLLVPATVIAGILAILFLSERKKKQAVCGNFQNSLPFVRKSHLFTPAERLFFAALSQAIGDRFDIFGKVRGADVLGVPTCMGGSSCRAALERISGLQVDFVLCKRDIFAIACGIILVEDVSPGQGAPEENFLAKAFEAACLPLLRFSCQAAYDPADLKARILAALESEPAAAGVQPL